MEQFLKQSSQAEDNFYRMEERRLQAEDNRREAEHARELHMLQMLGQMFSNISSARPGSGAAPPPHLKTGVPTHATVFSQALLSCTPSQPSPPRDSLAKQGQLLKPNTRPLGISVAVTCAGHRSCRSSRAMMLCDLFLNES